MRKAKWLRYKPTVRTAIALTRLLIVRKLRKGHLTGDDFTQCARIVTPPEDQDSAMEIAVNVLTAPIRLPVGAYKPTSDSSALAQILAEIKLAEKLESEPLDQVDFSQSLDDLLTDPELAPLLEEVGGSEAAQARFAGPDELLDYGSRLVEEKIGGLSETMFSLATGLGLADKIAGQSKSSAEREAAKVLQGHSTVSESMENLDCFSLKLACARFLSAAKVDVTETLQQLADDTKTIGELSAISKTGHVRIERQQLLDAIANSIPEHDFSELFKQTGSFAAKIAQEARAALYEGYPELNERQLSEHAQLCSQWKDALERAIQNRSDQAEESSFGEGVGMLRDLHAISRTQGDPVLSQHLLEGIKGASKGVIKNAESIDDLLELINITDAMGAQLPADTIREQGYKIGLSRQEMDQVLQSRLALLKRMIEKGEKVYERFFRMIKKEHPNAENTTNLAQVAIKNNNAAALAALGHYHLDWTLKAAKDDPEALELVIQSLSSGPGSNLLVQWFSHRDAVPQSAKKHLRRLAKEVLVQYAVSLGKEMIGDRSQGVLEGESVRCYIPGDDPSLLDMEETVENIISQGKSLRTIGPEDLCVRETIHGRRAVAMLVDISGSMQGEKMTWCAIAAAMLAYTLRPDELALAFFESDTHVVKSFDDKMEIEEIADELLGLTSQGGTMLSTALDWVTDELKKIGHRRKNALILTDAAIYDLEDCAGASRLLFALHTQATWFVPQSEWAESEAATLAKWSNGTVVRLHENWRRFPVLISEALR